MSAINLCQINPLSPDTMSLIKSNEFFSKVFCKEIVDFTKDVGRFNAKRNELINQGPCIEWTYEKALIVASKLSLIATLYWAGAIFLSELVDRTCESPVAAQWTFACVGTLGAQNLTQKVAVLVKRSQQNRQREGCEQLNKEEKVLCNRGVKLADEININKLLRGFEVLETDILVERDNLELMALRTAKGELIALIRGLSIPFDDFQPNGRINHRITIIDKKAEVSSSSSDEEISGMNADSTDDPEDFPVGVSLAFLPSPIDISEDEGENHLRASI